MNIEVCVSPALFEYRQLKTDCLVIIIDVLRATSCFSALFDCNAKTIVPIEEIETLHEFKLKGFLTAAERGGKKVDTADFGNSPTVFLQHDFSNKSFAYSTTNGTKAVISAAKSGNQIITACFNNLDVVIKKVIQTNKDVLLLCSGWQNNMSMEDIICAGAISNKLQEKIATNFVGDTSRIAAWLWNEKSKKFPDSMQDSEHYIRLQNLGMHADLDYCFRLNTSSSIPEWNGREFEAKS